MRRLSTRSADLSALCQDAARLIPDDDARARFLADVMPEPLPQKAPGLIFFVQRDITGSYTPSTPLRSGRHATLLAIPSAAFRHSEPTSS